MIGNSAPAESLVIRVHDGHDAGCECSIDELSYVVECAESAGVPVAIWSSIPCTGGSQWQQVNVAKHGVTDKLREHWRQFHNSKSSTALSEGAARQH